MTIHPPSHCTASPWVKQAHTQLTLPSTTAQLTPESVFHCPGHPEIGVLTVEWGKNGTLRLFWPSQMISQRSGEKDVQARKVPPVSQLQVLPLDILVHKLRHAKKVLKLLLNLTPNPHAARLGISISARAGVSFL